MRNLSILWLLLVLSTIAFGVNLGSNRRIQSIAADAQGSALVAKQAHQEARVHQRRRRSALEIRSTGHVPIVPRNETNGLAMTASQPKGRAEPVDLKHWELCCYAPFTFLIVAVAFWKFCKYLGLGFSFFQPGSFVETENGAMDIGRFLSVSTVFLALVIGNDLAVSSAAAHSGGSLPVHPACIVCLAELTKAIITLMIWLGNGQPIDDKQDSTITQSSSGSSNAVLRTIALMMVPATIYTLNNMLSLFALSHIHIAHIAVLRPTGVAVFNCVVWLAIFGQKSLVTGSWGLVQKGLGILLCLCGGFINSYDFREGSLVLAPQAALMLLASTFLSAFGAVANEFVLKYRMQLNIDFQNLCLYCMTVSLSLGVLFGIAQASDLQKFRTSSAVRVVVCYNAIMGLAVSRVLKQMGSLSKMVLGIVREPFEVIVAPLFVASELTPAVFGSTLLTVAGGFLYFLPPGALERTSSVK